jgi:hypothetical protein
MMLFFEFFILIVFWSSFAIFSQCCKSRIICALGLIIYLCVFCFMCLQAMNASTSWCSQLPCHYQRTDLSPPLRHLDLPPSPLCPQLFVVNMLVCKFACNCTPPCKFALEFDAMIFSSTLELFFRYFWAFFFAYWKLFVLEWWSSPPLHSCDTQHFFAIFLVWC